MSSVVAVRRRFWTSITIMIVGVATIITYMVLSLVFNAQPSTAANPGWVAVLQSGDSSGSGEILLRAEPVVPGAPGDHPAVIYSVLACGDHPFRGVLLLGGQARLDSPVILDQHMISSMDRVPGAPRVIAVPDLTLGFVDMVWRLGPVQEIPIVIDQPTPCFGPAGADQPFLNGTGTTIRGLVQGPIQRTGSVWGINGPHTSQVWPLLGGVPTSLPTVVGVFTGINGLQGKWSIPAVLHKQIDGGSLSARATVDVAIPPLSDTSKLVWDSAKPIRVAVRVTNIDDMDRWQNWLLGSGILLGIGASLLTSLMFEWLRSTREADPTIVATTAYPDTENKETAPARLDARPTSTLQRATALGAIAMLAFVAYFLGRSRR